MKKIISAVLILAMFVTTAVAAIPVSSADADPSANYTVQTAPNEDADIRMWFNHANVKVHQEDTTSTGRNTYSVYMAKNEYQGTQVTLYSPSVTKTDISANVTNFTAMNGSGATMSADVYYEFYIKCENLDTTDVLGVNSASASFIRGGMIPDAMAKISEINQKRSKDPVTGATVTRTGDFTLTAGKTQTLYIKIKSELDTPSGWYSAQFNVTDYSGNVIKTATVYAYVWNFEIPEATHLQTAYYINYHAYNEENLYKKAYDFLLDNRICGFAVPGELNSSNEYLTNPRVNASSVQRKSDYNLHYNSSEIRDIYNDLSSMSEWDTVKDKIYFYTTDEPTSKDQHDALLEAYGRNTNTLDDVRTGYYTVAYGWPDDPHALVAFHENHPYPAGYDRLTAWNSSTGRYIINDDHSGRFDNVSDAVQGMMDEGTCTVWCVQPYFYTPYSKLVSAGYTGNGADSKVRSMNGIVSGFNIFDVNGWYFNWESKYGTFSNRIQNYIAEKAAEGKDVRLWNYVCGNETAYTYCNHLIENTGLQSELLFWQTMQTGATGFLYYGTNLWNEYSSTCGATGSSVNYDGSTVSGVWQVNRYVGNGRGDYDVYGNGVIMYGKDIRVALHMTNSTEPVGTVRIENIRDGIEEYEMLYMYREAFGETAMQDFIKKVSNNVVDYLSMPSFSATGYSASMTDEDVFAAVRIELGNAVEEAKGEPEVIIGDVNDDGLITLSDLAALKKFLAGVSGAEANVANSDVSGDGLVTIADIGAIKKLLA